MVAVSGDVGNLRTRNGIRADSLDAILTISVSISFDFLSSFDLLPSVFFPFLIYLLLSALIGRMLLYIHRCFVL